MAKKKSMGERIDAIGKDEAVLRAEVSSLSKRVFWNHVVISAMLIVLFVFFFVGTMKMHSNVQYLADAFSNYSVGVADTFEEVGVKLGELEQADAYIQLLIVSLHENETSVEYFVNGEPMSRDEFEKYAGEYVGISAPIHQEVEVSCEEPAQVGAEVGL